LNERHDDMRDTLVSAPIELTPSGRQVAVLLIDPDVKHARAVARVLKSVVPATSVASRVEEAPPEEWDVVIASYDALSEQERVALLQRFALHARSGRLILVTGGLGGDAMSSLVGERGISHFLARHGEVDSEELLVTLQKILRADVFGLEKYFPWGAAEERHAVRSSADRGRVVEEAQRLAEAVNVPGRLAAQFCTAVDELVTNALYNAPVDAEGRRRFAHLPRTTPIQLDNDEQITVMFASDGRHMGVAVQDPFGSLEAETLLAYLSRCLRKGEDQVDDKPGGAGLGLFYVYQSMTNFVVNVARGQRTESIGLLDIRGSFKDFALRPKSLNAFFVSTQR
jgi:anti-sigma regulatory factor (Ser/Thr protein kinase)